MASLTNIFWAVAKLHSLRDNVKCSHGFAEASQIIRLRCCCVAGGLLRFRRPLAPSFVSHCMLIK